MQKIPSLIRQNTIRCRMHTIAFIDPQNIQISADGIMTIAVAMTRRSAFLSVNQPAFAPPNWLFPVVWTILYVMMGIASYLVYTSGQPNRTALHFYALQLLFNFLWSFFFFNLQWFLFSFIWLIALWILVFVTTILFAKISKPAGYLMIPSRTFCGLRLPDIWHIRSI